MESQLLDKIEWESRRAAAAFGINQLRQTKFDACKTHFEYLQVRSNLSLAITNETSRITEICARDYYGRYLQVWLVSEKWLISFPYHKEILDETCIFMARGLYRLGFEDESVLSQLPSLSAHEKMELHLSMPREFWPLQWGEEAL